QNREGLAIKGRDGGYYGLSSHEPDYPGDIGFLLAKGNSELEKAAGVLQSGKQIDIENVTIQPPLMTPGKIICIGLNYVDHSEESGFEQPDYPTVFSRFASSLIGHGAPIVRPRVSDQLDYEGELAAVIGTRGRHIGQSQALSHVAGYTIFNDASVRDFQFKSPQWTVGKNFDRTGAFGPEFVTADELPQGGKDLRLETRVNGQVVQSASTSDMVFDVEQLITILSEALTLEPGDVIVTGTCSGVGIGRKPPLFLKPGDICEVEIESLGILSNPVEAER
ncbi:fumarylacetoacetate hydrolase family protein, partial [Rhodobacteraceae bacterium]|nr:fumarylacetoacetate hydrolase family protein [Paracoccaceae bacterium]